MNGGSNRRRQFWVTRVDEVNVLVAPVTNPSKPEQRGRPVPGAMPGADWPVSTYWELPLSLCDCNLLPLTDGWPLSWWQAEQWSGAGATWVASVPVLE